MRGANLQSWGRQPIILVNFPKKLHENGKKMDQGGAPVAPPPRIRQWLQKLKNSDTFLRIEFFVIGTFFLH